ncbi:MAG TPA: TetR/AcrR family transcriptional regulator [Opitutaceae bacterium]|jgi:AcrR family transcriptional regulator|nr:TetR/AcrR family transcriptional regulator [Opitutaceae bacterium]
MASKKKTVSRDRIIKFAVKEFSRAGLAGARMDNIARRAKISKGRIYYHFKNKDDLFAAVLQSAFQNERASQAAPEHPVSSIRFWSDFYRLNKEWSWLLIREGLERRKENARYEDEARRYWEAAVARMRLNAGPGNWPEFLDQSHLLLALVAIEIAPIAFPHLARLITGKDPESSEFQRERTEFLTAFAQFCVERVAPAASPGVGPRPPSPAGRDATSS